MNKRRIWLGLAVVTLAGAVTMLGGAVATAGVVTSGEQCNSTGRLMCLTVSTFSDVSASQSTSTGARYAWAEWSLRNRGGNTLTHPTVIVSLTDLCGANACTNPSSTTAAFVLPDSANACSPSGSSLVCTYANLNQGAGTPTTRVYFSTALLPATSSVIKATALVKERQSDSHPCEQGDPNCDTLSASVITSYEPDANGAASFALPNKRFHLASNNDLSSFEFTSKNPSIFLTQFRVAPPSSSICFGDVPCFERILFADTQGSPGFGPTNPVVFYGRSFAVAQGHCQERLGDSLLRPGDAAGERRGEAVHGPGGDKLGRIDGVSFGADAAGVIAAGKYFVVNYNAADNSFQIALKQGGSALSLLSSGAVAGPDPGHRRPVRRARDDVVHHDPASISFPLPSTRARGPTGETRSTPGSGTPATAGSAGDRWLMPRDRGIKRSRQLQFVPRHARGRRAPARLRPRHPCSRTARDLRSRSCASAGLPALLSTFA